MNLLLYAESRQALFPTGGETNPAHGPQLTIEDLAPTLPDSLFEELGYFGAVDDDPSSADLPEDDYESLFLDFAGLALAGNP